MAKEKEVVNSTLTKTQAIVMRAICVALDMEISDKKLIGKKADLTDKDGKNLLKTEGVMDVPKVCRQLNREDLVVYRWNDDRSRTIEITEEGFKQLQCPIKERTFPAKKEKPATEAAKSAAKGKEAAKKEPPVVKAQGTAAENDEEEVPLVKKNTMMKNFLITFQGRKKIVKAKDQAEFDAMKDREPEEWLYLFVPEAK